MASPSVSVIIPVYNIEKYLPECLDSVVNQTLKDIEIICVDDGSTDASIDVIRKYQEKDSRIYLFQQKNQGPGPARNLAIRHAKGEFVCFMDSDDYYPSSDILKNLYEEAKKHAVQICGGEFACFTNEDDTLRQDFQGYNRGYLFPKSQLIPYKDYQFDYGYHRFIYNREMLIKNDIFFPSYRRYEDPPFLVKAMITAQKFYGLHQITYAYRQGHKEINWTDDKIEDLLAGVLDNMRISHQNNLKRLNQTTYRHLCEHSPFIIHLLKPHHIEQLRQIYSYYKPQFIYKKMKYYILSKILFSSFREKYKQKYLKYIPLGYIIKEQKDEKNN